MIVTQLLNEKYRFKEDFIPKGLTQSQLDARKLFLEELHKKNKYIYIKNCPYCGNVNFTKISEVDKRGIPSDIVICNNCDGCFKSTVLHSEAAQYYYRKISARLRGKEFSNKELDLSFEKRKELFAYQRYNFISHFIDLNPREDLIMEFGCYDGANLAPWKEYGFCVLGIDLDSNMVEFGKSKGLNLINTDIMTYEHNGKRPKLIILSHVLGHVTDINTVLNKLRAILQPDGYVFIETPNIRLHGSKQAIKYFDVEFNYCFDLASIIRVLENHRFNIIYKDEYIHLLCTPRENRNIHVQELPLFHLDRIKISPFKLITRIFSLNDVRLYGLLKKGEDNNLKIKIFRKLQRLYLFFQYNSIAKRIKK